MCVEFWDEILLRGGGGGGGGGGGECETRENPNFLKKGKMVISVKILKFSRSRMIKRTLSLESSREI